MRKPRTPLSRRAFLERGTSTAAATLVARHVLGGPRQVPPSDRISVAYVGAGTQGLRQLMPALAREELRIVAVCDPNRKSEDYVEWFRHELRDKVRTFLGDPSWAEGSSACPCGREVGREIVDRHYASPPGAGCRVYADFREMLAKEKDLDAVYVMTPDHLHATIALAGLRAGKHVIMHKPLANVLQEARLVIRAARETGAATHMFCSAAQASTADIEEWIQAGAIGPVREVHNWSTRPFWPQGMTSRPTEAVPVPDGFDWDLWLGPVPHRPYHPSYTHAVFRGWYDFGTGALGDMGHYSLYQVFKVLKLGSPLTVEASRSQYWRIDELLWKKQVNTVSYPQASLVRWEFAERPGMPPLALHWYDGGLRPPTPRELQDDGEPMPEEGLLFVGDEGKILAGFSGQSPRLIPRSRMARFTPPPRTLPRPAEELDQWIRACRGGAPSDASFPNLSALTETILLGTIAIRVDKKLRWDAAGFRFVDAPEADALMTREYREGWTPQA
ncbi:MAG TPA: Gfo/Idh/MocA family oxidoreductase [Vicinamibacteria bacterium]|nr:Gfo/Idh/MocA family oxidoreductase [Vicinamibacteria bacterium]